MQSAPAPPPDLVDRYTLLRERVRAWKPDVNPHLQEFTQVRDELLKLYESADVEQSFIAEGTQFEVPVSKGHLEHEIKSLPALLRRVGQRKFMKACSVTLAAARKLLDKDEWPKYISESRGNHRELGEPSKIESKAA